MLQRKKITSPPNEWRNVPFLTSIIHCNIQLVDSISDVVYAKICFIRSTPLSKLVLAGKSFAWEGSPSFKKLEKLVWRKEGGQLNKFRRILFTTIKKIASHH